VVILPYCSKCGREIEAIGLSKLGMCPSCGLVDLSATPIQGKPSQAKYCQYCGRELPTGVSFCPACGASVTAPIPPPPTIPAKPRSKTGRNIIITVALIFILLIVGGLGYGVYEATRPPPASPTPAPAPVPTPTPTLTTPIGQQYDVVIRYTERYADEIGYSQPDKGYTFLIVTLDIENRIDKEFSTSPVYFTVVVNNVEYDYHWATYSLDDSLKGVDLHKGGRISGSIVFEVPKGTTVYTLLYEGFWYDWKIGWIHY